MPATEKELAILRQIRLWYGSILVSSAVHFGHRSEVLAGIMMRETEGGTSKYLDIQGPGGRGDNGHGHGLCQIDDRSFPEFCAGSEWRDPAKNIDFAAKVLSRKRAYIRDHWPAGYVAADNSSLLERAAIAAYNAGEGNIVKCLNAGLDVDTKTAHGNYSREVLRFAAAYAQIRDREARA